jgi:hypothetical protein
MEMVLDGAEQDLGTSDSRSRPTPGKASTTKGSEETDAEKHQTRRLRDTEGNDAGGTVRVQRFGRRRIRRKNAAGAAALAARDVDVTEVAGKPARPGKDEHLATTAATPAKAAVAALCAQDVRT